MTIMLPPEQMQWLEAQVAAGRFSSIDEAVRTAIEGLIDDVEADDGWIKPLLDEAQRSFDEQGGVDVMEVVTELDDFIAKRRPR